MTAKKYTMWRYLGIAIVFCLACVIYLGRLFYIQISGRDAGYNGGTTTRTVTVQAVRGEIYDRNGKALVKNSYTYDLTLPYASFSVLGVRDANEVCLSLMDGLDTTGDADKHTEAYFPLEGAYPYYSFSAEAIDGESVCYYRLRRVVGDIGLDNKGDGVTVDELVEHYVNAYDLLAVDAGGKRIYNDNEIDRLIRLRYDMDALRFTSAGEYTFAEEIGMPLMTYVKEHALSGTTFTVNVKREYLYAGYASHILGTVGPIYSEEWDYYNEQGYQMNAIVGKTGCEYAFEQYLHGSDGKLKITEDASGNVLAVEVITAPVAGSDIRLTIDIDLQIAAEDGLAENVEFVVTNSGGNAELGSGCNAGAAVAMDPNTFEVLAIASYPTYDLSTYNLLYNQLAADEAKPLLNRALNGVYAPGSTYKVGVAAAALSEGAVSSSTTVYCNGTYGRYHKPACSTSNLHSSRNVDLVEAIADSCNCFFYELGYLLGIDTMNEYMSGFGFGQSTGVELGGSTGALAGPEYRLQIHHPYPWQEGDVLSAAIGQSDNTATPIQLACYLSTLVGGGTRYSAHLLHSVYTFGNSTPTYTYAQTAETTLSAVEISSADLATVLEGMRQVVAGNNTVRRNMADVPVTVGCKTGTAQNSSGCDNALFVCAAPYDNPEIVISVVLEQGYSGGYSSLTAANILEQYYGVTDEAE